MVTLSLFAKFLQDDTTPDLPKKGFVVRNGDEVLARFMLRLMSKREFIKHLYLHPKSIFTIIKNHLDHKPLTIEIRQTGNAILAIEIPKPISHLLRATEWYSVEWTSLTGFNVNGISIGLEPTEQEIYLDSVRLKNEEFDV